MRFDPNKAVVNPMDEPLRWICNEFFHDLKRRTNPTFNNTVYQDANLAMKAGFISAIGLAELLKYDFLPKVQHFVYSWNGSDFDLDKAIFSGLGAATLFAAWYFRPMKMRNEYMTEHHVYPNGVKGVIGGAIATGVVEYLVNNPSVVANTLDAMSHLD